MVDKARILQNETRFLVSKATFLQTKSRLKAK